jgi:hypothetical protein
VLGRKTIAAVTIPNMAIRNIDVIAQAIVRLPLHKAWTIPPKGQRANAVAPPRVANPLVNVTARLPLGAQRPRKRARGLRSATVARANGSRWGRSRGSCFIWLARSLAGLPLAR